MPDTDGRRRFPSASQAERRVKKTASTNNLRPPDAAARKRSHGAHVAGVRSRCRRRGETLRRRRGAAPGRVDGARHQREGSKTRRGQRPSFRRRGTALRGGDAAERLGGSRTRTQGVTSVATRTSRGISAPGGGATCKRPAITTASTAGASTAAATPPRRRATSGRRLGGSRTQDGAWKVLPDADCSVATRIHSLLPQTVSFAVQDRPAVRSSLFNNDSLHGWRGPPGLPSTGRRPAAATRRPATCASKYTAATQFGREAPPLPQVLPGPPPPAVVGSLKASQTAWRESRRSTLRHLRSCICDGHVVWQTRVRRATGARARGPAARGGHGIHEHAFVRWPLTGLNGTPRWLILTVRESGPAELAPSAPPRDFPGLPFPSAGRRPRRNRRRHLWPAVSACERVFQLKGTGYL